MAGRLLVIALLGFLCYARVLQGAFLLDDQFLVRDNPSIKSWSHIGYIFTKDVGAAIEGKFGFYRPLQTLTYMVDHSLWRDDPAGYHLTNIFLHILAAFCLFWFLCVLSKDINLSFWTSLFFAAHPVHTEAVAYISGRADPLALIFLLLTFIFYLKYEAHPCPRTLAMAGFSFVMALLSRESSVVLPALILMRHGVFRIKVSWKAVFLFLALIAMYAVLRFTVFASFLPRAETTTWAQRLPGFFVAIANYGKILVWPMGLHMEYGKPLFSFHDPRALAGIAIVASAVAGAVFAARKKRPIVAFALGWFFVSLLPVANLYPLNAYMAEHWLYLPSIGFFLLLSDALTRLAERPRRRFLAASVSAALLVFYGFLTVRQCGYWIDQDRFYEKTLEHAPDSPMALNNLGNVYAEQGRLDDAVSFYQRAIALNPVYADAYFNLGVTRAQMGQADEAAAALRKSLELDPRQVEIRGMLDALRER